MTHRSTRLSHVFLGVGLTILVALAPVLFIVATGPSASADEPTTSASTAAIGNISLANHESSIAVAAALAVVALVVTIIVGTRAERGR